MSTLRIRVFRHSNIPDSIDYVTGFCIGTRNTIRREKRPLTSSPAVLIFYSPRRVQEAFYSQILTIYSLLLTCLVSVVRGDLTRFHALVVLALVLSPITVYFVAYSIRSFWSDHHRLESLLGRTRYLRRFLVLLAGAAWVAILIFSYLPNSDKRFAQPSCKGRSVMEGFYLIVPFLYIWAFAQVGVAYPAVLFTLPFLVMIAAWTIAILRRKKEIWPPGEPYRPRFIKVWSVDSPHAIGH